MHTVVHFNSGKNQGFYQTLTELQTTGKPLNPTTQKNIDMYSLIDLLILCTLISFKSVQKCNIIETSLVLSLCK